MKTRLFSVFVLVTGLALLLAWSATAQAPSETEDVPFINDAISVTASQSYGNPAAVTGVGQNIAFVPDRLIVKFRAEAQPQTGRVASRGMGRNPVNNFLARQQVQSVETLFPTYNPSRQTNAQFDPGLERMYRLQLQPGSDVLQTAAALAADPRIEWAEPDYIARAAIIPDDPLYSGQWGLDKIQAPAAWDVVTGTATVVIAIIDSGIDQTHTDLSGQLWVNPGEIPANSLDDDNNGYVDDVNGWDFVNDDNNPGDDNGHGTQVAGIAAASTEDGTGIAGVCWNCRLMPVKVMQASGIANYSDIAQGVIYAAEKGAKVINISLGGYSNSSALRSAIQTAVNTYGAVVVGGAGNDDLSTPFYPAAYAEALAVAATTLTDTKAVFSDYGSWVDVSAPGKSITTTFLGGDWGPANGTSFAAPFVSGLALIRSQYPAWSEALVRAQIERTADSIDAQNPAYAGQLGSGRINAATAVTQVPHPILTIESTAVDGDSQGRPTPGQSATLQVTLSNDWLAATGVTGVLTTTDPLVTVDSANASFGDISAGETGTNSPVYTFTADSGAGYNHPILFSLDVTANGGAYSATLALTVTTRSAEEQVFGTIATDTTWTSDKTYIVEANIGVAPGVTLTIEAGTEVRFNGNYNLTVGGTLIADSTAAAPIVFRSHTGSSWGQINFTTDSADAVVDANYSYLSGSILRYVTIEDAGGGLACDNATPYFSHLTLAGGGVNCTPGTLWMGTLALPGMMLLQNSDLAGGLTVSGMARLVQNDLSGNVSVSGQTTALTNTVQGSLSLGSGSLARGNSVRVGSLTINGSGTVISNSVTGGGLSVGSTSQVLTNTVTSGGISAGGGSEVRGNNVERASSWAVQSSGSLTVTANRLVDNGGGLKVGGGLVQGNLVASNSGTGLEINGDATVISNTFTGNGGSTIKLVSATSLQITGNNLERNTGPYDIENLIPKATLMSVPAQYNWWGTTGLAAIAGRIFDYNDDFNKGQVLYSPVLTGPAQTAPAYVRSVTLTPGSPVGIEQVAFEVEFSRAMDVEQAVETVFFTTQKGTWQTYNASNSGLVDDLIYAIAVDEVGNKWFGTGSRVSVLHPDGTWQAYDTTNSGLAENSVIAITMDGVGNKWFGFGIIGGGASVLHPDGTWQTYNTTNSGLAKNDVNAIAVDGAGNIWFGTAGGIDNGGVSVLRSDGTWQTYNTTNSGLVDNNIYTIAVDGMGNKWFGTWGVGVSLLRTDGTWQTYNSTFAST